MPWSSSIELEVLAIDPVGLDVLWLAGPYSFDVEALDLVEAEDYLVLVRMAAIVLAGLVPNVKIEASINLLSISIIYKIGYKKPFN